MPHCTQSLREDFLESFKNFDTEWWENFQSPTEAVNILNRLWNCNDNVPVLYREDIVDCIEKIHKKYNIRYNIEYFEQLIKGCTYAQLSRALKKVLKIVFDKNGIKY